MFGWSKRGIPVSRFILMGKFELVEFFGGSISPCLLARRLRKRIGAVPLIKAPPGFCRFLSRIWRKGEVSLLAIVPGGDFLVGPIAERIRAFEKVPS